MIDYHLDTVLFRDALLCGGEKRVLRPDEIREPGLEPPHEIDPTLTRELSNDRT